MGRDIIITPNTEIQFSGLTISTIRLKVENNGDLYFQGSSGTISNIYDNTSNLLMSVRGASAPVFQVSSNDYIQLGKYSSASMIISSDRVGIGTLTPSSLLHIKGASGSFRLEDGNQSNGYVLVCDSNGVGTWKTGASVSTSGGITFSAKPNYITKFTSTGLTSSIMYQDNNKIGIGITSANARLHVVGTNSTTTGFAIKVESASASPTLYVRNDGYSYSAINNTNTKVYYGGVLCEFINESYNISTSTFSDIYNTVGSVTMSNLFKRPGDKIKVMFNGTATGSSYIKLSFSGFDVFDSGLISGSQVWHLKSTIIATNTSNLFRSESIFTYASSNNNGTSFNILYQNAFTSSYTNSFTMSLLGKGDGVVGYSGVVEFLPGSSN